MLFSRSITVYIKFYINKLLFSRSLTVFIKKNFINLFFPFINFMVYFTTECLNNSKCLNGVCQFNNHFNYKKW